MNNKRMLRDRVLAIVLIAITLLTVLPISGISAWTAPNRVIINKSSNASYFVNQFGTPLTTGFYYLAGTEELAYCADQDAKGPGGNSYSLHDDALTNPEYMSGVEAIIQNGYPFRSDGLSDADARYATQIAIHWIENYYLGEGEGYDCSIRFTTKAEGHESALAFALALFDIGVARPSCDPLLSMSRDGIWEMESGVLISRIRVDETNTDSWEITKIPAGVEIVGGTVFTGDVLLILRMTDPLAYAASEHALQIQGYSNRRSSNIHVFTTTGGYQTMLAVSTESQAMDPDWIDLPSATVGIRIYKQTERGPGNTLSEAGASFQIYRSEYANYESTPATLRETVTTGADGIAETTIAFPLGDYTIHQISAPFGVNLAEDRLIRADEMNAFENVSITDTTANGYVELFKRIDRKGTFLPEPGAVFQIYLAAAGSYENANSAERDEITTNADGYARSQLLPIGEYCIRQISAPVGTRILEETRTVNLGTDDKGTPIQNDAERIEIVNSVTEGQIAITKTADNLYAEPGATFAVYLSSAGSYEAADFREKDTITTDYRGIATSKPLPYGIYTVHQTDAPPGTIAIADYEITVGAVDGAVQNRTVNNLAQNCRLVIEKVGEVLTSAEVTETQYKDVEGNSLPGYSFQYSSEGIAGASFALFVGEQDILDYAGEPKRIDCDGDGIRETELSAGTKIGVIEALPVKDADGSLHYRAEYSGLPLNAAGGAQYIAREIAAPYGQILSDEPLVFDFTYADQSIEVISQEKTLQNKRQIPEIYLDKQRETSEWNPATDEFDVNIIPAEGVLFGIYTAWEIKDSKGNVLVPAGAPVDYLITDALGHAKGGRELPPGVYYVRELRAAEGSVFDDKKTYTITFSPQEENDGDLVSIPVNEGVPILNREIRGVLSIEKIAEDTGLPLAGVHFAVYDTSGNKVDAFITNEAGEAMTRPLPYGEYTLAETETKEGYALMENKEFNIYVSPGPEEDYSVIPMQLANQKLAAIEVFKITEDGQVPMSQVVFEICDMNSGEEIQRVTTDQNGYARAFVQPGSYLLRELSTWEGYCISEEPIVIENAEYQGIYTYRLANRRSQLVVYKESTDGLKLADMEFKVVDKDSNEVVRLAYSQDSKEYIAIPAGVDARDALMTGLTDSEGRAIIRGLPSGSYDVIEVKAPNGYILDEDPIQIKMNTNETEITPEVTLIDKHITVKTGEQTRNSMMIGGSVLCALGLVLLLWIKKRIGKQA